MRHVNICNINISSEFVPVWLKITRYIICNYVLYRYHVTGMAGRQPNWTSGQMLHRSQSLRNLTPGEEREPETRLHSMQVHSRSHANIGASSVEEGLELLGSATDTAISNFEEVDTSVLDYDSDTPEASTMQAPAAMDTDAGQRQDPAEMDATYF
jgi:hypothetical protein